MVGGINGPTKLRIPFFLFRENYLAMPVSRGENRDNSMLPDFHNFKVVLITGGCAWRYV